MRQSPTQKRLKKMKYTRRIEINVSWTRRKKSIGHLLRYLSRPHINQSQHRQTHRQLFKHLQIYQLVYPKCYKRAWNPIAVR